MSLTEAMAALDRGDGEAALELLLDAWREARSPALAETIEKLSALLTRGLDKIDGTGAAREAAWLAVEAAGRAVDVDRLLEALLKSRVAEAEAYLERLGARPADPRFATYVLAAFSKNDVGARDRYWSALLKLLAKAGDPRSRDFVEKRLERALQGRSLTRLWQTQRRHIRLIAPALLETLPLTPPPPPASLAEVEQKIATLGEKRRARSGAATEEQLLADITARWDDDGPKLVYADWLLERGGQAARRGELIVLQCKKSRDRAKEKELLRDLAPILGPVADVVKKSAIKLEKGFLVEAEVKWKDQQQKLVGHPIWATVRRLSAGFGNHDGEFYTHPIMRSLRIVEESWYPAFAAICASAHPTTIESISYYSGGDTDERNAPSAVGDGHGVPRLRHVLRQDDHPLPRVLLDAPLFRRLERLDAIGRSGADCPLAAWLTLLDELDHPLPLFGYQDHPMEHMPRFLFARGADGRRTEVEIVLDTEGGMRPIENVRDRLTRITLTGKSDAATLAALDEALAGRRVEIVTK